MTTKHTPGPWNIEAAHGKDIEIVGGRYVARVYNHSATESSYVKENYALLKEAQANAHLIAAAPELLETCKYILQGMETPEAFLSEWWKVTVEFNLRQAITKAEGGES